MSACCGHACSKVFVILYNILFWVSGIAFTALGGLLIYDKTYEYMYTLLNIHPEKYQPELLFYASYAIIGLGGLILFVGFFGCCGALQNSKCMIGLYIFFLIIICFAEAAIALGCVYCHFSFKNSSEIRSGMRSNFQDRFNSSTEVLFTEAVDYIQFSMKCCGIQDEKDYDTILNRRVHGQGGYNQQQKKNQQQGGRRGFEFPTTCCVPEDDFYPVDDAWKRPPPKNPDKCQSQYSEPELYPPSSFGPPPDGRYSQGCWTKISEYFGKLTCIIAAASGGFALLQILGILFSLCFIRNIGEEA